MKNRAVFSDLRGVIVTSGIISNSLGVVRAFGRRGIPVIYIGARQDRVSYSRYVKRLLLSPRSVDSEKEFINTLLDFGKEIAGRIMIIPTGDSDVLALSKHKLELEEYYYLPVPSFEIVQKLANKKTFYKLLAEMNIPHPKTYFPESISDLRVLGSRLDYPYIIKPALSLPFACEFERKNFVIHSPKELSWAIDKLKGKNLDVIIQEIIPGKEIYMFYTYFNKKSEPLAICGYDKIRQYPDDYGSGSFCRSNWILSPIDECIKLLKTIRYYGFAEPELIKDPRDGSYKLLEINARTTTQNRLAAACGADMEYISYLDAAGYSLNKLNCSQNDVFWVDDFSDQISCCIRFKQKELGGREILRSLIMERKVHSIVALDDPVPFILMTRDIIQWNILNALRRGNDLFKRMLS